MTDLNHAVSEKKITYRRKVLYVIFACYIFILVFAGLVLMKKLPLTKLWAKGYEVKGVDISHYQGKVDMPALEKQGMQFVIIKATEGSSSVDERFEENWDFWQYSDTTELDGYRGEEKYIDCNVFWAGKKELEVYMVP